MWRSVVIAALCARARGWDKRKEPNKEAAALQDSQREQTEDPAYITSGQPAQVKHIQLVAPPIYLQAASEAKSTIPDEGGAF